MQVSSCLVTAAPPTSSCRCRLPASKASVPTAVSASYEAQIISRRELGVSSMVAALLLPSSSAAALVLMSPPALAADSNDEEYVKETSDVIKKVRATIGMDKTDPNVASAVAELRDASNSWVAKYRREKALLGRASFRDMYSALNAVSGHYISFGPTAPIPAKRKARILEEVDTAEKALLRGR